MSEKENIPLRMKHMFAKAGKFFPGTRIPSLHVLYLYIYIYINTQFFMAESLYFFNSNVQLMIHFSIMNFQYLDSMIYSPSAMAQLMIMMQARLVAYIFGLLSLAQKSLLNTFDHLIYYVMNASLLVMILLDGVVELFVSISDYVDLIQKVLEHGTFSHIN